MIEQLLREHLRVPDLSLHLMETQGLATMPLRQELREKVLNILEKQNRKLSPTERERVLDLSKPLREAGGLYISISHASNHQGILLSSVPCGLDIEEVSRVKAPVVARVSKPAEIAEAPTTAQLWAAKEAAYKALNKPEGPTLLSQIEIGAWSTPSGDSRLGMFRVNNLREYSDSTGLGCVIEQKAYVISTFFLFA